MTLHRSWKLMVLGLGLAVPMVASNSARAADIGIGIAGPNGYSSTFSTGNGLGVAVNADGSVDVSLPNSSPFSIPKGPAASPFVQKDASGLRVFVPPPTAAAAAPAPAPSPIDVNGLLGKLVPGVKIDGSDVQVDLGNIKVDTANGTNVAVETPKGEFRFSESAMRQFNQAQTLMREKDYDSALQQIDAALMQMPREPQFHQLRSLVLFFEEEYQPAAESAYQALSLGPAWDWKRLSSMFADAEQYTLEFRKMQQLSKAADAPVGTHFLMAYHCLMLGHRDAARMQLEKVADMLPQDALVQSMLSELQQTPMPPALDE